MTRMEKLALLTAGFEVQLKAAKSLLDHRFREPVKNWLLGLRSPARDIDCVRAYIQSDTEKRVYKLEDLDRDFKAAAASGAVTYEQLKALVACGAVGVINNQAVASTLSSDSNLYTELIPAGDRPALKFHILADGRFQGMVSRLAGTADLAGAMNRTLSEGSAVRRVLVPGRATIQRR